MKKSQFSGQSFIHYIIVANKYFPSPPVLNTEGPLLSFLVEIVLYITGFLISLIRLQLYFASYFILNEKITLHFIDIGFHLCSSIREAIGHSMFRNQDSQTIIEIQSPFIKCNDCGWYLGTSLLILCKEYLYV